MLLRPIESNAYKARLTILIMAVSVTTQHTSFILKSLGVEIQTIVFGIPSSLPYFLKNQLMGPRIFQTSVSPFLNSLRLIEPCARSGSQILDTVFLETPPFHRETMGWWVDIPRNTLNVMRSKGINAAEAIHAAEHAIMNCFAMQQDIKTECKVAAKEYRRDPSERKRPARYRI